MQVLWMPVGVPRSGKSSWARTQSMPIVCPDAIRLALYGQAFVKSAEPYVWAIARTMVEALFIAGHKCVILDATNTLRVRRDDWRSPQWTRYFMVVDTGMHICYRRAVASNFPLDVLERMMTTYEAVTPDELGTDEECYSVSEFNGGYMTKLLFDKPHEDGVVPTDSDAFREIDE